MGFCACMQIIKLKYARHGSTGAWYGAVHGGAEEPLDPNFVSRFVEKRFRDECMSVQWANKFKDIPEGAPSTKSGELPPDVLVQVSQ